MSRLLHLLPRAAGGRTMDSIVREVVTRSGVETRVPETPTQRVGVDAEDAELERILPSLRTNIKIVGIGGGGCNTIDRLVESGIVGAELFAADTDAQHLLIIRSPHKLLLGRRVTRGLGAGALPQVGEESAREAADELRSVVQGADMVFITCGLGGGTGTGGAPVLAQLSKEAGALTIAICTFPFRAEGAIRAENAEYGLEKLRNFADTVVVIPNDKLLELVPRLALNAAFKVADDVLMRAIKGITEIITKPGLVNLDFNDIKTIMKGGGVAMIGLGESDRDNRSEEAIEEAINSPLIDVDISAATGALVPARDVEGRRDRPGSDRPERPDHLGSGGRPEPGAQASGHAHLDRSEIETDPRAGRARAYPRRRRHRTVRFMADIVDKSWEVQRRIEERAKRLGKGRYGRVLKMARRATPDEYSKVVLITGLGIAAIGALGFLIYLIMRYGPGLFHGIFGFVGR